MSTLFERYLGFINSVLSSKKCCLSSLAKLVLGDEGSLSAQNIMTIGNKAGLDDILSMSPKVVADSIVYCEVPVEDDWRITFLEELILLRSNHLELDFVDVSQFSRMEIDDLIYFVATS